jgi:hypoxanthine phosphoribosyltransferase
MIDPCSCYLAGFCDRHQREKTAKEIRLCRRDWQYRKYYDDIAYGLKYQEPIISVVDLVRDTQSVIPQIDQNSIIMGIARCGMLPASIIATSMHLPLYSISRNSLDFVNVGSSGRMSDPNVLGIGDKKIYLVDDSSCTGLAMKKCYNHLKSNLSNEIVRVAIYVNRISKTDIEIFAKSCNYHFFEWNVFNCLQIMYDIDGVLCRDFTEEECRDDELYLKTLQSMSRTKINPTRYPISLVTGRLERYRSATEKWLSDCGFSIKELIMWPGDSTGTHEQVGAWKAKHFAVSGNSTFCESNEDQSKIIFSLTGKTVICADTMTVYNSHPAQLVNGVFYPKD